MKTVCVVGAGVIGCASAYALHREGMRVILLDAQAGPGEGASKANGAQLSYSYVEPLASPATLRALPSLLIRSDSPLHFSPQADWRQWDWCVRFLWACRTRSVQRGTRELLELARLSKDTLDAWTAGNDLDITVRRNGKLVLCACDTSLKQQQLQLELQARWGCQQVSLSREQCLEMEPALAPAAALFVGGIWTASECSVDPHLLCHSLSRRMAAEGAVLKFNTTVHGFIRRGDAVSAARTAAGDICADAFVIAGGPQAASLARSLDIHLPIYPVKGYSLSLPVRDPSRAPSTNVTHLGIKTVFAPLGNELRVAAMAELVGYGLDIQKEKVERILQAVDRLFPGACDLTRPNPWVGLRPATPDSLPLIGPTPLRNVWVNAGHGALGLTLAAGSANRLTRSMLQSGR